MFLRQIHVISKLTSSLRPAWYIVRLGLGLWWAPNEDRQILINEHQGPLAGSYLRGILGKSKVMHVMRADVGIVKVALDEIINMEDVKYV